MAKSADLNELLDRLGATKQGINIVILDACRNNPFSGVELVGPDGRRLKFRGATPAGLAPVEAPLGSMKWIGLPISQTDTTSPIARRRSSRPSTLIRTSWASTIRIRTV